MERPREGRTIYITGVTKEIEIRRKNVASIQSTLIPFDANSEE